MLRVVLAYFRSGGTLLNKCLAAIPQTVVLSEVSPIKNDVVKQAAEWHGIELQSTEFVDAVRELNDICDASGRCLIVRLWVVGEFAPGRRDSPPPTYELTGYRALAEAFDDLRAVALVRDPIDIWISRGCWPSGFFANYKRYANRLLAEEIPIQKYEDLCRNPEETMQWTCRHLQLPFDESFLNFHAQKNVKGDVHYTASRGRESRRIKVLKRRRVSRTYRNVINESKEMVAANSALGYPISYEGVQREAWLTDIYRRVRSWLRYRL